MKEGEKLNQYELRRLVVKQREQSRKLESIALTILTVVSLILVILWGILKTQ